MITVTAVAHESNKEYDQHGENIYLVVKAEDMKKAKELLSEHLRQLYHKDGEPFYYEFTPEDVTKNALHIKRDIPEDGTVVTIEESIYSRLVRPA